MTIKRMIHLAASEFSQRVDNQLSQLSARVLRPRAAVAALAQVEEAFARHRTGVDRLVLEADEHKKKVLAETGFDLRIRVALLLLLGLVLIGGTLFAALLLNRHVVTPLTELADATAALAAGDDVAIPHVDRPDELGKLASSFAHFRKVVVQHPEVERRDAAEKATIVDTLADTLRRVAEGDLRRVLAHDFEGDYRKLGDNMNQAIATRHTMIQEVVTRAASIQLAAREIASASADLSARTQSNAAPIEETSAALVDVVGRIASTRDASGSATPRTSAGIAANATSPPPTTAAAGAVSRLIGKGPPVRP